jgi:hypothetical protein
VRFGTDIYVAQGEYLEQVVCMACSIQIKGTVGDAVAIMGGIENDGEITGDAAAIMGGIKNRGAIRGDLVAVMGGGESSGEVGGDAVAVMGGFKVSGPIGGDAVAVMGGIQIDPGGQVGGDTVAVLGGVEGGPGRSVGGEFNPGIGLRSIAVSAFVVALLVFLFFALALWPFVSFVTASILGAERVETIAATLNQRAGMCFLIGVGVFAGSFVASIVISVALFWLPSAGLLVGLAFFVTAAVGYAGIGLWVGRGLVRTATPMGATVLGSALITVIQLMPLIGWFLAWPIFGLLALGAATVSGFGTSVDWLLRRAQAGAIARPAAR